MRSRSAAVAIAATLTACGAPARPAPAPPSNLVIAQPSEPAPAPPSAPTPRPSPKPAPASRISDGEVAAVIPMVIAFMEDLGHAIAQHEKDCPGMAVAIEAAARRHRQVLALSARWKGDASAEQRMTEALKQSGVIERTMTKIVPGLTACANDPKVAAALKKLEP